MRLTGYNRTHFIMKKILILFIAIVTLIAFSSCEKEQLGVFNPTKKIHKIYQQTEYASKHLTETWTWDNNKLMQVDYFPNSNIISKDNFEYDGNFMSKIVRTYTNIMNGQSAIFETSFSYNGKKLVAIHSNIIEVNIDLPVAESVVKMNFFYEGNKISKMEMISDLSESSQKSDFVFSSLRYVLPAQIIDIIKETQKNTRKSIAAENVITVLFTWDGNNVIKTITETQAFGVLQTGVSEISYDKMNNPCYGYFFGSNIGGLTKNNPTKVITITNNDTNSRLEQTYSYTYKNRFPIEIIKELDRGYGDKETTSTYYEYLD